MKYRGEKDSGYIALITMLVAVFVCTALIASSGWGVWYMQQSSLLRESSAQARELAQSCVRLGLQRAIQDASYIGPEIFSLPGGLTCAVLSIHLAGAVYTLDTQSTVNGSLSRLHSTVSATTYEILARSQSP